MANPYFKESGENFVESVSRKQGRFIVVSKLSKAVIDRLGNVELSVRKTNGRPKPIQTIPRAQVSVFALKPEGIFPPSLSIVYSCNGGILAREYLGKAIGDKEREIMAWVKELNLKHYF